ncbi:hypothetical protein EL17_18880 [Anditalea andensis]|uniref:Uncharacterized protein n=1 Tax=Anditalea andensis TaxID=1048983 RepID=A0A074KVJ3_9BACT|nr:hypothetical protein EL17_18880 [Anditalea andensis]
MLTPLAWATRLLVPRCLAVPQFLQERGSTPMALFFAEAFQMEFIMEQRHIISSSHLHCLLEMVGERSAVPLLYQTYTTKQLQKNIIKSPD